MASDSRDQPHRTRAAAIAHADGPTAARIDKRRLADHFGRRCHSYDEATPVQESMAHRLVGDAVSRLAGRSVAQVLELGCGTGRMTRMLRRHFPDATITAIDLSPGMIAAARSKVADVSFVVADAEAFLATVSGCYDLIISNAALQWFDDPRAALARACKMTRDGGVLAASTFGDATFRELRQAFAKAYARTGITPVEHIVPMRSLAYWQQALPGGEVVAEEVVRAFPDVIAFLHSVRAAGAVNALSGKHPMSRGILQTMIEEYPRAAAGIAATYHTVYLCR